MNELRRSASNSSGSSLRNIPIESRKRKVSSTSAEVFLVLEESILTDEIKATLSNEFYEYTEADQVESTEEGQKFPFLSIVTPSPGLIHWIRCKDTLPADIYYDTIIPHLLPMTAFLIPTEEFVRKIIESENGIDFSQLDQFVTKFLSIVRKHQLSLFNLQMRFIFLLSDVDKIINKFQKKVTDKSVPQLFDQAIIHLLFSYDIEIFRFKKCSELSDYLHTVTRTLHNTIEKNCSSAFSIIMKASKLKPDDCMNGKEKDDFEMRQTWAAMLQMIPQLSKERANAFISNSSNSCPKKVFEAMNNDNISVSERINSIQTTFGKGKNGNLRQEVKLAKHVFKLMTVSDPEATIIEET